MSSTVKPDFAITFFVAATGPIPMISGSTPARAPCTQVAIGLTPNSLALASLITTTAAAPSLIPLALPAVTIPPSLPEQQRNLDNVSTVVPGRGPSSFLNSTTCFFTFTETGTISSSNLPSF